MTIAIADSILGARDRIVEVLADELQNVLDDAELANVGYPLPTPEAFLTQPVEPAEAWRRLNINQCAVWVMRDGNSRYPQTYAGSPDEYSADQITRFRVSAIFTPAVGFELPTRNGRTQTESEWLADRAEIFRGCLIDTLTNNLHDGTNVNGIQLVENGSDVATFDNLGPVARCSVVVEILQGVRIKGIF